MTDRFWSLAYPDGYLRPHRVDRSVLDHPPAVPVLPPVVDVGDGLQGDLRENPAMVALLTTEIPTPLG